MRSMRWSAAWSCSTVRRGKTSRARGLPAGPMPAGSRRLSPGPGAASTCSISAPRPAAPASASTPPKRRPCAARSPAWPMRTAARSISSRPASPCSTPIRSFRSTMPPIAPCGISTPAISTKRRPIRRCSNGCARRASCLRSRTSGNGRRSSRRPIAPSSQRSTLGTCPTAAPCAWSPRPIPTAASPICSTT